MPSRVTPAERQVGKRQIMELVEQGVPVRQAKDQGKVPMHRATVYRLIERVRTQGEAGYADGRSGHPVKVRGEIRTFLIESCQANPSLTSPKLKGLIQERFDLCLSVSQLNRVRASLGLTYHPVSSEKKSPLA
jgi:transposase